MRPVASQLGDLDGLSILVDDTCPMDCIFSGRQEAFISASGNL